MSWRSRTSFCLLTASAALACTHPSINHLGRPDGGAGGIGVSSGGDGGAGGSGGVSSGDGGAGGDTTTGNGGTGGDTTTGAGGGGGDTTTGTGGTGAVSGSNMIANGDFSNGDSLWVVTNGGAMAQGVQNGTYCLTLGPGQSPVLGWPSDVSMAASLRSGAAYQISYAASSTGPLGVNLIVKVGQAVSPYAADFMATDTLTSTPQPFFHTFTAPMDDAQAGIAFELMALGSSGTTSVCFDNVTLVAQ